MAAYKQSHTRSSGRLGRNYLFLLILALMYLASFYACSRPEAARRVVDHIERAGPIAPITGRAWVVDGDTIHITGIPIRLDGIDAPEKTQACIDADGRRWPCGQAATRRLRERIGGRRVTCKARALDR